MDGTTRCARYAFGPNRLHYCGPDANQEIGNYIREGASNPGLEALLKEFRTMYPYLRFIAEANGILDPFDDRVVEAYWIGNELLENIGRQAFWRHLVEGLGVKKYLGTKSFSYVEEKLGKGAAPHHSFHVLDIWKRTGHLEKEHTLQSMDECRVSWGRVVSVDGPAIEVDRKPLVYREGKLTLEEPLRTRISRKLESEFDIEQLKTGDLISIHWGVPCEVLTPKQAENLEMFTLKHLALANETL